MFDVKTLKRTGFFALLWIMLALLSFSYATYAWFSNISYTTVNPMRGTIGDGDTDLRISNSYDGPFGESCNLKFIGDCEYLYPVSTCDLEHFYTSLAQNRYGVTILYADANENVSEYTEHGLLYVTTKGKPCEVYFSEKANDFGNDVQALASARLGMKVTRADGTETKYIFHFDGTADDSSATERVTVVHSGDVIQSIDEEGRATTTSDTAEDITLYYADDSGSSVIAGEKSLFSIEKDEIVTVEYWVYLEGCDDNCFNSAQYTKLDFSLGFAGVKIEDNG